MKHSFTLCAVLIAGSLAVSERAVAQQPPDVVTSDSNVNTAMGTDVLLDNSTGIDNTGAGAYALYSNTTGRLNTAFGVDALNHNAVGSSNTGLGVEALYSNTEGYNNTASGLSALQNNSTGNGNTASGAIALNYNTTGSNNTAFGYQALYFNTSGKGNAAQGVNALYSNTTGIRNLAIGSNALYTNVSGSYNIALGFDAGYNVSNGSNNIEIGSQGNANDNATIQIGSQGTQTQTSIAGIYGTPILGSAVYVTSGGQLGVQASSERYKTDISTMPAPSEKLAQLRPVTFHYQFDANHITQYGLIAEEVAKVYPELVIRDQTGKIQGLHYEELAPLLLSEAQKQQATIRDLAAQNALLMAEVNHLKAQQQDQSAAQAAQFQSLQRQITGLLAGQRQYQAEVVARR